jgi:hypothetical protein
LKQGVNHVLIYTFKSRHHLPSAAAEEKQSHLGCLDYPGYSVLLLLFMPGSFYKLDIAIWLAIHLRPFWIDLLKKSMPILPIFSIIDTRVE